MLQKGCFSDTMHHLGHSKMLTFFFQFCIPVNDNIKDIKDKCSSLLLNCVFLKVINL